MAAFAEPIWEYLLNTLYCPKTKLFYDYAVPGKIGKFEEYLPAPALIRAQIPNPCGWGTGMEDAMILGGVLLDALITCYGSTRDERIPAFASDVFEGMKTCASVSSSKGFLARSVSPVDGVTHYGDSSRDQYTHWIVSAVKYYESELSSDADKAFIRQALCAFAGRAKNNVTAEHGWNLLREDGGRGIATGMWENVAPHEAMRLPMFYLAAWKIGGDEQFAPLYRQFRDEAMAQSEKIELERYGRIFAIHQMQLSLRFVYDYDTDEDFKRPCLALMKKAAAFGRSKALQFAETNTTPENRKLMEHQAAPWDQTPAWLNGVLDGYAYYSPMHFKSLAAWASPAAWLIRDLSDAVSLYAACPEASYDEALMQALKRMSEAIDYQKHCSDAPAFLLLPYYLLKQMQN